jgi:flavin-dependent dehydrogenase
LARRSTTAREFPRTELIAIEGALGLHERDLERLWNCLRRFGNLPSVSVLLVLEDVVANKPADPGTPWRAAGDGTGLQHRDGPDATVRARSPTMETDVCVIGGGPAGLATALAVRRYGFSVLLVDRARPPIDKACGEGLMPEGVAALRDLGIDPGIEIGRPYRGIRFLEAQLTAEASFAEGRGLGIRRADLHRLLLARAEQVGVIMRWGSPAEIIGASSVDICGQTVHCRWIIGADGAHSRVRLRAGLRPVWTGVRRIGLRQHFRIEPWTDFVEVHWRQGAQAYVTPVGPNEICIAVLSGAHGAGVFDVTSLFPALARRLRNAEPIGPSRGAISMSARLARVTQDRTALVGDAAGAADAITGEGVSLALRDAIALGRAIATGDLASYEIAHRRHSRLPLLAARLLLYLGSHDGVRGRVLQTLAAHPRIFNRLLAAHVGTRGIATGAFEIASVALRSLSAKQATPGDFVPRDARPRPKAACARTADPRRRSHEAR